MALQFPGLARTSSVLSPPPWVHVLCPRRLQEGMEEPPCPAVISACSLAPLCSPLQHCSPCGKPSCFPHPFLLPCPIPFFYLAVSPGPFQHQPHLLPLQSHFWSLSSFPAPCHILNTNNPPRGGTRAILHHASPPCSHQEHVIEAITKRTAWGPMSITPSSRGLGEVGPSCGCHHGSPRPSGCTGWGGSGEKRKFPRAEHAGGNSLTPGKDNMEMAAQHALTLPPDIFHPLI